MIGISLFEILDAFFQTQIRMFKQWSIPLRPPVSLEKFEWVTLVTLVIVALEIITPETSLVAKGVELTGSRLLSVSSE